MTANPKASTRARFETARVNLVDVPDPHDDRDRNYSSGEARDPNDAPYVSADDGVPPGNGHWVVRLGLIRIDRLGPDPCRNTLLRIAIQERHSPQLNTVILIPRPPRPVVPRGAKHLTVLPPMSSHLTRAFSLLSAIA